MTISSLNHLSERSVKALATCSLTFMLFMAINYLNFNLFGRNEIILVSSRVFCVLILMYMFARAPAFTKSELIFLFLGVLSIILGAFKNIMAVNVVFIVLFAVASKRVPIKHLIDNFFVVLCVMLGIVFLSLLFGITQNSLDNISVSHRARWNFGFANVNSFVSIVYGASILALFRLSRKKASLVYYLSIFSFIYYVFLKTDTRSIVLGIFLYCLIYLCFLVIKSNLLLKILALAGLILPVVFINSLSEIISSFPIVDLLLSFRGSYALMYMSGLPDWYIFFGGVTSSIKNTDMGLVILQSSLGFLFLGYLMMHTFWALSRSIQFRLPNIYAFILSFWAYGLAESSILRPETIIGLVFWVLVMRSSDYQSVKKHINLAS